MIGGAKVVKVNSWGITMGVSDLFMLLWILPYSYIVGLTTRDFIGRLTLQILGTFVYLFCNLAYLGVIV